MIRTELPKVEEKQTELTERDATVIVINNWTRKFWEAGKALEARFEEYAIAQMDYEQQLLAASEQLTEKQQELLETAEIGAAGDDADDEERRDSHVDDETAARAASLAEAAAATTELMRHEPEPVFVTGFIDSGSTNCFAGAYELKIRLEHVNNRLRILLKALDEIGDEDEDWE
jgi:cation transport regulator ChaB